MRKFFLRISDQVFASGRRATAGNVAILFALAFVPLFGLVGLAMDWSAATTAKRKLQNAADAAVLAGARAYADASGEDETTRRAAAETAALRYFEANMESASLTAAPTFNITFTDTPEGLRVNGLGEGEAFTAFTGLFGASGIDIGVRASAIGGDIRRVELVLALDNTGSMASANRMNLMRAASKAMVNEMFDTVTTPDKLFIGVLPWTSVVNIAMERPVADWTPAPFASPDPGVGGTGVGSYPIPYRDFRANLIFPYQHILAPALGGAPVTAANFAQFSALFPATSWRGCIRQADGERTIAGAVVTDFTENPPAGMRWQTHAIEPGASGDPNNHCPPPMLGLSASREQVIRTLDRMRPSGNTYQDIGMMWGVRMLSPRDEWVDFFGHDGVNRPKPYDPSETRKILVLLTDGENVVGGGQELYYGCTGGGARGGAGPCWKSPTINPLNDTTLDNLLTDVCDAARVDIGIEVFTIAVDVTDATAISLLDRCAGGPGSPRFENIRAAEIESVLLNIARESLRLTR